MKFIKKMKNKADMLYMKMKIKMDMAKENLANVSGEGYVDTAVKIIINVVVGSVVLAGLYALFKNTVIPKLNEKITAMINYNG